MEQEKGTQLVSCGTVQWGSIFLGPITRKNSLGFTWTTLYDIASRVNATVDPLSHRVSTGYDAASRPITCTNGLGFVTTAEVPDYREGWRGPFDNLLEQAKQEKGKQEKGTHLVSRGTVQSGSIVLGAGQEKGTQLVSRGTQYPLKRHVIRWLLK